MYVVYCKNCGDGYTPKSTKETQCSCGITSAILEEDKVKVTGDPFVLSMDDKDLSTAIYTQQQTREEPVPIAVNTVLLHNSDEHIIT